MHFIHIFYINYIFPFLILFPEHRSWKKPCQHQAQLSAPEETDPSHSSLRLDHLQRAPDMLLNLVCVILALILGMWWDISTQKGKAMNEIIICFNLVKFCCCCFYCCCCCCCCCCCFNNNNYLLICHLSLSRPDVKITESIMCDIKMSICICLPGTLVSC